MKCPNCQFENPESLKFCGECGAKLERICSECGSPNPPQFKFCGECGKDLVSPKSIITDYSKPQSYTPKFLAEKILTTRSSIEGERKLVTVLFADVANYTAMSESLGPEEVHQIMDVCFGILMDKVHKHEGTINQFTGDGIMALFGAPVAHEDHAQRACHAALSIQQALSDYSEKVKKDIGLDFSMRIGLNSGPVIVGAIGDDLRMDYTAIGDTTNLASRMENMAKPGAILVSDGTHRLVKDYFEFKSLGKVAVKGKAEPQETFELLRMAEVVSRIEAARIKGLTRFVGRANSMASLMDAYTNAKNGSGQVVGIVGEAGVGKSRLLLEFRSRLPQGLFTYYEGRCLHYGGSMPYIPILDILKSEFDIKYDQREFIVKKRIRDKIIQFNVNLAETIPPIQDLLSLKVDDKDYLRLEPIQRKNRVFEAIRNLLIQESRYRFLMVAIEDLHWIDKTSEEFLDYFIGWLTNAPILLILLYRPEYTHQWGSKSYYNRIGLNQLTTNSSAELVEAVLAGGEIVSELRELILNAAAGNPLFLEEITHTLVENGSIQKDGTRFVLAKKLTQIQAPDTIQGLIAARMDRLEENLKEIMQVASVIGREFSFRILQTIIGMRGDLKSSLLKLQGLEFIYEKNLFPDLEYIFKHALTQEVAYNSLLDRRRKEIHEKIGIAIEEIYSKRLEEYCEILAYHYSKSENFEKAYVYRKLSGDKAVRNYSAREAFRFYRDAIQTLKRVPETEQNQKRKIDICILLSIPMHRLVYPEDSLHLLQEGESLAKEIGDKKNQFILQSMIGSYYTVIGPKHTALEYIEKAFLQAERTHDIEWMAPIVCDLTMVYIFSGKFRKTMDVASRVLCLLEENRRECDYFGTRYNVYSGLCGHCAFGNIIFGNYERAKSLFDKGLYFAERARSLYGLGHMRYCYGLGLNVKGDTENAIDNWEECIKILEKTQAEAMRAMAWTGLGFSHCLLGNLEAAEKFTKKGSEILSNVGRTHMAAFFHLQQALVHFEIGDLNRARKSAEESLLFAKKMMKNFGRVRQEFGWDEYWEKWG